MGERTFHPWEQDEAGNWYQGEKDARGRMDGRGIRLVPGSGWCSIRYCMRGIEHGKQIFFYSHGDKSISRVWNGT